MVLQKILIKEAKRRGYNASSLAKEIKVNERNMQRYFKLETSSSKITEELYKLFS